MIIDHISNAARYFSLGTGIQRALAYIQATDLQQLESGKYEIAGTDVFAIVQEYDTKDAANEQLESHKKYIDVQYVISGEELMGHSLLHQQAPSKAYSEEEDYMLFSEAPAYFSKVTAGMFTVFFPSDLHMPCIKTGIPAHVKKVVIKISTAL